MEKFVVAGVILLDRNERDALTVECRYDVPGYLPLFVGLDVDAAAERFSATFPDTHYVLLRMLSVLGWREDALFYSETVVVPFAVGSTRTSVV